jgi:hypothetical protein
MYLHDWEEGERGGGKNALISDFRITEADLDGAEILVAAYTYEDYSGEAYVLFKRDGKLYEVYGSHCSCFGLEYQWEPEEATKEAILHRLDNGTWGEEDKIADHVRAVLNKETN